MKIELHNNDNEALHAVIIPLPAQGHITPSLQLAKKLVAHGFRVTFVNTTHNHDRLMQARSKNDHTDNGIEFVSVSDGLPENHPRLRDATAFLAELLEMGPVFEELFIKLLQNSPITCVISDIKFLAAQSPAKKLGIPAVAFAPPSALFTQCQFHVLTFVSRGILPLPPPPPHAPAPSLDARTMTLGPPRSAEEAAARQVPLTCLPGGSPAMRVEDLPTPLLTHELDNFWYRFYRTTNLLLQECDCILYNTFHDLEKEVLDTLSDMNSNIFAVGPLILNSTTTVHGIEDVAMGGSGSGLWEEDGVCVSWLEGRSRSSVLYISFGSIATMSVEQMQEFASGLEMSGHAFLWVVRSDLIEDMCGNESMFSGFVERTRDRALLVPWAPQTAVLSHPAVAAFLTHCGWNSIIESISSGVTMLASPQFFDQNTNCHYITHVWKIGLRFESEVRGNNSLVAKEEVARKVRQILAAEGADLEVDAIRSNSRKLQTAARKAVANGGSSHSAMKTFVELVQKKAKQSSPPQQSKLGEVL